MYKLLDSIPKYRGKYDLPEESYEMGVSKVESGVEDINIILKHKIDLIKERNGHIHDILPCYDRQYPFVIIWSRKVN